MKRVLFLAYLFPPIANSGTQRPLKFAKYLSRYGWEPIVMTAAHFEGHHTDPLLLDELPSSIRVIRVPMLNEAAGSLVHAVGARTALAKRIGDGINWRLRARFRSPDLYALWRPMVRREALRLFRSQGFDAIYATGFPWTTLMAGVDLSRATGRPLIADFRDPWAGEDLFRTGQHPSAREAHRGETLVIGQAAAVISVAPSLTHQLMAAHPEADPAKFTTICNGFDPADVETSVSPPEGIFRIVYTGVWKDGYNPSPLYDVIDWLTRMAPELLEKVEVVTAGYAPGEAQRRGLADHIHERGVVPHREAVALMRSASMLFGTNGDGNRQLIGMPGKFYEYLASGRPVLALTHPRGDAGQMLGKTGGGVAISPDDPGLLLDAITMACRNRRLDVPPLDREALASYDRATLTGQLAVLLDRSLASGTAPTQADAGLPTHPMLITGSGKSSGTVTRIS